MHGAPETPLVSVIIPVYNAERYLRQCLDSVRNQTLKEIEILCVDDGSTDASPQILEEYAAKDSRFQIFRQQNRYAGCARNLGMEHASGKYLVFWDADDFFEPEALEKMYAACERDQAQICVCGAFRYHDRWGNSYKAKNYLNVERLPERHPFSKLDNPGYLFNFSTNVPWNKMFLRWFVEQESLRFMPLRQANDIYFVMLALYHAQAITTVTDGLIHYRVGNFRSLTGRAGETRDCTVEAFAAVQEVLCGDPGYSDLIRQSFRNKVSDAILNMLREMRDVDALRQQFFYYHHEVLEEFGLTGRPEAYFYNPDFYRQIHLIEQGDPEAYLYDRFMYYWEQTQMLREKKAEAQQLKRRLQTVESSTAYQVGRAITCLPRAAKDAVKAGRNHKK